MPIPDENGDVYCPVLIMRDIVVFPRMVSPIFVTPGPNLEAINHVQQKGGTMIALVLKDSDIEKPKPEDFLDTGVEIAVGQIVKPAGWQCFSTGAGTATDQDWMTLSRKAHSCGYAVRSLPKTRLPTGKLKP